MKPHAVRWLTRSVAATALGATVLGAVSTHAAPWDNKRTTFASPRFEQVWRQTDANPGSRSLTWGPKPWFDYKEFYKQSPNGLRQVQYFDKARMEINDPSITTGSLGGVTNGLLPVELVSGRAKLGDGTGADQNDQRTPAAIPVAGDLAKVNTNAPTYASFGRVATTDNGYRDGNRINQRTGTTFDKEGNIGYRQDLADLPGTEITQFSSVTGHNVPRVFFDYENGGAVSALDAFGYPITDPYWVKARVGGVEKDVMVQIFERRVLTYTPANNAPYKVEMGNVGQHYFQWRYPEMGTPWDTSEPYLPVAFASTRASSTHFETFTTDAAGNSQGQITATSADTIPSSLRRSWEQSQVFVVAESRRDVGGKRQLYRLAPDGSVQRRLMNTSSNDFMGAASPDGGKIAFASDRTGRTELFVMNLAGTGVAQLTTNTTACVTQAPSWLPDGTGLLYESNCTGNYEIYRADLKYTQDKLNDVQATLINVTRLTSNTSDDHTPRLSPDGTRIVFEANRDGNAEIYVMNLDGSLQRRLTNSSAIDSNPAWSPDGTRLVYESNRDGDYELYTMNASDGGNQTQITNNGQDDRYPVWAQ